MRVTLGEIVVDTDTREIARQGTPIHVSPKAFELLLILIEYQPKAVSREILQERLWPSTFVVEKNLTNLVAELRRAVGDTSSDPRFIRTVTRFGYALRQAETYTVSLTWQGGRVILGDGEHVMGRASDAAVCLDSQSVSRHHALIRVSGVRATLEDLGSKNGTAIGDTPIEAVTPLADGDRIRIGSVVITCRIRGELASTRTEVVVSGGSSRRPASRA